MSVPQAFYLDIKKAISMMHTVVKNFKDIGRQIKFLRDRILGESEDKMLVLSAMGVDFDMKSFLSVNHNIST